MPETAEEARDRAVSGLVDQIADDAGLRTADELEPGCMVKVCGDWYTFNGLTDRGQMRLGTEVAGEFTYGPTDGERFVVF